jgi:hypothetical protein
MVEELDPAPGGTPGREFRNLTATGSTRRVTPQLRTGEDADEDGS